MLTRIKYDQLLERLAVTATWLSERAQIQTAGTRFDEVYTNVQEIVRRFSAGEVEELIAEKGNEEIWLSLTESDAFTRIHSALKNFDSAKLPRKALKDMLGGPLLPREETPNTAHSRNILFELELAARFHEAGIDVIGFDDVQIYLHGSQIGIQCKRPYSEKGVKSNLRLAKEQIRKKHGLLKQGMIAFAIDKIYETDRNILVVNNQFDIPSHVTRYTNDFIGKNKTDWHYLLNTKIIAILICMRYICHIKDINLLTTGFQFEIFDRGMSAQDRVLLQQIRSRFASKYHSPVITQV